MGGAATAAETDGPSSAPSPAAPPPLLALMSVENDSAAPLEGGWTALWSHRGEGVGPVPGSLRGAALVAPPAGPTPDGGGGVPRVWWAAEADGGIDATVPARGGAGSFSFRLRQGVEDETTGGASWTLAAARLAAARGRAPGGACRAAGPAPPSDAACLRLPLGCEQRLCCANTALRRFLPVTCWWSPAG